MESTEFMTRAQAAWDQHLSGARPTMGTEFPPSHPPSEFLTAFSISEVDRRLSERVEALERRVAELEDK